MQILFTMGEVARLCGVVPATATKWFDSGKLEGYRLPGSRHRRVTRESLISFMNASGIPLGELGE